MTPVEVEANRKRAQALLIAAKQIVTQVKEAGYSFAETPEETIGYALDDLNAEPLRDIDARYDEIQRQAREGARVYAAELNAKEARL